MKAILIAVAMMFGISTAVAADAPAKKAEAKKEATAKK